MAVYMQAYFLVHDNFMHAHVVQSTAFGNNALVNKHLRAHEYRGTAKGQLPIGNPTLFMLMHIK